MADHAETTRRAILAAGLSAAALVPGWAIAAGAVRRDVAFEVWRNNQMIGTHTVRFRGDGQDFDAEIEAEMTVRLGPVPVFHYVHKTQETWRAGRFAGLESTTTTNGKREQVSAMRTADGVAVTTGGGKHAFVAPAVVHPLTHWNRDVLDGPLFNPETGAIMRLRAARGEGQGLRLADGSTAASRVVLTGEAEITDWYDEAGAWGALHAKATDGSYIDYRRA